MPWLSEGHNQPYGEWAIKTRITGSVTSEFGRWDGKKDVSSLCDESLLFSAQ